MHPDPKRTSSTRQGRPQRALVLAALLIALTLAPAPTAASPPAAPTAAAGDDFGGGPIKPPRDLTTEAERAAIQAEVERNIARLTAEGRLSMSSTQTVSFEWPLRAAANLTDYGYHGVSGFMDHNPATNALLDYMCGDRTYDLSAGYNHRGTDFFTYPFPWLKMDSSQVEIVAAAAGTLVFKRDGGYDRQCEMTGALSNAVVIQHADGTIAWYLHMKEGSVTTKPVGATIALGEYLGVVGSSGSSTGPHLHFEVRPASGDGSIDPFTGPCNAAPSLWAEQPPYYDAVPSALPGAGGTQFRGQLRAGGDRHLCHHLPRSARGADQHLSHPQTRWLGLPDVDPCQHARALLSLLLVVDEDARRRRVTTRRHVGVRGEL